MNIKQLFSLFTLLVMLFGTTQMSVSASLPMEHIISDMHSMVEIHDDKHISIDCAGQLGCEMESSCGGHLCSAIFSVIAIQFPPHFVIEPMYRASTVSLYIAEKDKPPQFLMY